MTTTRQEIVVDISVLISWCFAEAGGSYGDAVLDEVARTGGLVAFCWPQEVGHVLARAEAGGRLTVADSSRFTALLRQLPLRLDSLALERALEEPLQLARRWQLSFAEAASLELALREGVRLATLNQRLRQAATACHARLYGPPLAPVGS